MLRKIGLFSFIFFNLTLSAQVTTFLWNGYSNAANTPIGASDYTFNLTCTAPARTVPVSANITSSAGNGIFNYPIVNMGNAASPAYSNSTDPYGTGQSCAPNGLVLGVDWANTTSFVTVTIYFNLSANGVTGPVKFSIDDVNSGTSFYDMIDISATTSTGVNRLPVITSPVPSNNTAGGGGCSGSPWGSADCNGSATSSGSTLTIQGSGNNGDCTNWANEFITVGSAADIISTLTIKYYSGTAAQTGNSNPSKQYIVISALTTGGVCVVVLPVELLSLSGMTKGAQKTINWVTLSENNNHYFTVERSKDAVNFEVIGKVKGNGTSQTQSKYEFSYDEENSDYVYYRLKQTDYNGNTKILNMIYLNEVDVFGSVQLFPNPALEELHVKLESVSFGLTGTIHIQDVMGRIVKDESFQTTNGENEITIHTADLPPGTYYLNIRSNTGGRPQYFKFIKA